MPQYVNYTTGEVACQDDIALKDGKRNWNERKRLGNMIGGLVREYDDPRGIKIISCGRNLVFARQPDGTLKLRSADFCRERMCPVCQWRRSLRLAIQCNKIYQALTEKGYEHIFVTLTIKNIKGEELNNATDKLFADAAKWQDSRRFRKLFPGGYRAFEITYNKDEDTYHPHMHYLLTVEADYFRKTNKNYIDHDTLMAWWRDIAGLDYDPSVRIQAVRPKPNQTMTAAAVELCKYPTKVADALEVKERPKRIEVLQTIDYALRGRRLVSFFGLPQKMRKKLQLEDVEGGDLVAVDDVKTDQAEDLEKVVYVWRHGFYVPMEYLSVEDEEERARQEARRHHEQVQTRIEEG